MPRPYVFRTPKNMRMEISVDRLPLIEKFSYTNLDKFPAYAHDYLDEHRRD